MTAILLAVAVLAASVSAEPSPCGLTHFRCVRATPLGPIEVIYKDGFVTVAAPKGVMVVKKD